MLVVLDMILQHLQPVQLSSLGMTDGSPSALLSLSNHLRRSGRVLSLHMLDGGVLCQKLTALHQGHGMRVNLSDGAPVVLRQATDTVGDMQLMLAHHRCATVTQQLIVMQQRAGDCVLYGQHADGCRILLDIGKHLFESRTADQLYLLSLEVQMCGNVVKRSYQSLNGNSLHILSYL